MIGERFEEFRNRLLYSAHPFVMVNVLASLLLLVIRLYEVLSVRSLLPAGIPFGMDLLAALAADAGVYALLFLFLTLLYHGLEKIAGFRTALGVHTALLLIVVLSSAGVSQYYTVTRLALGTDLLGYSWKDIQETVSASGGAGWPVVSAVALLAAVVLFLPSIARRFPTPRFVVFGYYSLIALSLPLYYITDPSPSRFASEAEHTLVENKFAHVAGALIRAAFTSPAGNTTAMAAEYPLYHPSADPDVFGPLFHRGTRKPNIVIIMVEGLGRAFVRDGAYGGFTPFLDSLAGKGLFFPNFLSTTGRTFGVLPSLTASLPFGQKGFMEFGSRMPAHRSLFTILAENGYRTSYFYGGKIDFDGQNVFLERQNVQTVIDEGDFLPPYEKEPANEMGFSWGYGDDDLFRRALQETATFGETPRLEVYMTLSTHEPFIPPHTEEYRTEFERRLAAMDVPAATKDDYRQYRDVYASLLYMDRAIENFIAEYQKRPDFANTIFLITGDHRLIPVPLATKIDRYRVPLIVWSPLLKEHREIRAVSTHADITPTLLSFLKNNYSLTVPDTVHWLGTSIDTAQSFRVHRTRAFMPYKGEISDYVDGNHFLSGDRLFTISDGLNIDEMKNDSIRAVLTAKRDAFIAVNDYVTLKDRIMPSVQTVSAARTDDDSLFARIDRMKLNSDQLFRMARDTAFNGFHEEARGLCRRLLDVNPDYHDVRTLMGRTLLWDNRNGDAETVFREVIRRAPNYADAYFGLAQTQYFSNDLDEAMKNIITALELQPENAEARYLHARLLEKRGNTAEALAEVTVVVRQQPDLEEAVQMKQRLQRTKR